MKRQTQKIAQLNSECSNKSNLNEAEWSNAIVSASSLTDYFGTGMWSFLMNKKVLLTQKEYDSLKQKDQDTLYLIINDK